METLSLIPLFCFEYILSGRNFSLKEMETTTTWYTSPLSSKGVRKELLSERDGNVLPSVLNITASVKGQEGTSL